MLKLKPEHIFYFRYAERDIRLYLKAETEKALEFRLFDAENTNKLTDEKIWLPKSKARFSRDNNQITGIEWIMNEYENKEKLRRAGYYLG